MAVTAWEGETLKSAALAAADLSANLYYAVTVGSTGVSLVAAQGAAQVKVLTNKPKTGDPCRLVDQGETKMIAGAAITVGNLLMTDSSGRFIPYVNNSVNIPVGEARSPATAAGQIFTGMIFPSPSAAGANEGAVSDAITPLAGGGRTGSPVLVNGWNRTTGAATTGDSVQLPVAAAGMEIVLINDCTVAATLQVFGNGSDTIDGVAGATGVASTIAKRVTFYCLTAPRWQSNMGVKST